MSGYTIILHEVFHICLCMNLFQTHLITNMQCFPYIVFFKELRKANTINGKVLHMGNTAWMEMQSKACSVLKRSLVHLVPQIVTHLQRPKMSSISGWAGGGLWDEGVVVTCVASSSSILGTFTVNVTMLNIAHTIRGASKGLFLPLFSQRCSSRRALI